jgi:diguanylate cyclase (GGDEF)-like protein/PAS domain S-box-containing protein
MGQAVGPGGAALSGASLRETIESALAGIVRLYVGLSVALLGLLAIGISHYDAVTRLSQDRELVVTRLTADLQGVTRQLGSLATSSLLWTGLTDSFGREAYLAPLLARVNAGSGSRVLVLDYRGRRFLAPEGARAQRIIDSEPVRRAVAEGRGAYGMLALPPDAGADPANGDLPAAVVLVLPVQSPQQTPAPVGYIVAEYDPRQAVAELPLAAGLRIGLRLADGDTTGEREAWLRLVSQSRLQVGPHPLPLALDVRVARSPAGPVLRGLVVAALIGLLGLMLSRRIQRWTAEFASGTTRRLERLVETCRDVLDGRPVAADTEPRGDEISAVLATLHQMLEVQQQITSELRTAARVFETSGEAIMVTDAEGRIVEVNPALSRMTGYARVELIGQHAGLLYREAENPTISGSIREALQRDGLWRGETAFRHLDGHLVPSTVAISRLGGAGVGQQGGMVAVISDISALKAAQAQLHDLAYRDSLTGLPNFRALTQTLHARLAAADAGARPFLVMFLDMDHLKTVNDTHGHDTGDAVIQALAAHLQARLPPGTLLCRRSGDEFVAIVDGDADGDDVSDLALRKRMDPGFFHFDAQTPRGTFAVSVSAGVARFPQDGRTMQELLIRADGALLQVKQDGRGTVRWARAGQASGAAAAAAVQHQRDGAHEAIAGIDHTARGAPESGRIGD